MMDEIGDLLSAVNKKADQYKSLLASELKRFYTSTDRGSEKAYTDRRNNKSLKWHHLSIYATGVIDAFYENLLIGDVTDGFVGRTILWSLNLEAVKRRKRIEFAPSKRLTEMVRFLDGIPRTFENDDKERGAPLPAAVPKSAKA